MRSANFQREDTLNRQQSTETCGILSIGFLESLLTLMSSRIDRFLFYVLSSGSILLALVMASTWWEAIPKRSAWDGQTNRGANRRQ
jgi:hypothetical protein